MALSISNTFHTPTSSDTIAASRGYWNSSFRAILQNFASANAIPVASNFNIEGNLTSAPEGTLYYNSVTGGLYLNSSLYGSGPYGTFRRLGLGTRSYSTLAAASSDSGNLDPGELIVIINNTGGGSNNRVYLVSDTNKTLVDVSTPFSRSVANTAIVAKSITGFEIANNTITGDHIAEGAVLPGSVSNNSITDSKLNSSLVYLALVI